VFAIGILSLGCENSDGNAIVASKPTQHANTSKSGWQNKNAFRFDVVRCKGDCVSIDLTAVSGRNRLRFTLTLNMSGAVFGKIVGADDTA
jgi:hypothetical protein